MKTTFKSLGLALIASTSLTCAHAASFTPVFADIPVTGLTLYGYKDPQTCLIWSLSPNALGSAQPYYTVSYIWVSGHLDPVYSGALIRARALRAGLKSDWRIPTLGELQDVITKANPGKTPGTAGFKWVDGSPLPLGQFWSSTLRGNMDWSRSYNGLIFAMDYVGQVHPEALGSTPRYTAAVRQEPNEVCPGALASPFSPLTTK